MNLVIVESPTKARTIGRFLGKGCQVKFSMGHVMDLPKSSLGVDIENGFSPQYEIISDKKKIIAELKKAAKSAKQIILATDPDREGEAIAAHVAGILSAKDTKTLSEKKKNNHLVSQYPNILISRIVFHEITKEAVEEALKNPRSIDNHLVDAQTARRVLDRLVGYKLSPILWRKIRSGLSAGRVQSVALRLIVEREREIERFKKEEYWTISAMLESVLGSPRFLNDSSKPSENTRLINKKISESTAAGFSDYGSKGTVKSSSREETRPSSAEFELIEINGGKIEVQKTFQLYDGEYKVTKTSIEKEEQAKKIVDDLKTKHFIVADVIKKEMRRSPQPPYTTSTLQQDAARRFGMNGKRTMMLAQKLYEEGYITYHRTDSVAVAPYFQNACWDYIKKEYGDKYLPPRPRFYKTKQKLAQEAHEAIRPTTLGELQSQISSVSRRIKAQSGKEYARLYELIWRRAVASQMSDAMIESTTVLVDARSNVILGSPDTSRDDSRISSQCLKWVGDSGQASLPQKLQRRRARMTDNVFRLKATGSVLVFDGFLKVNPLGLQDRVLPKFRTSEQLSLLDVQKEFHETLPPPRYNDASLIKTLEEKGIGRPSTYATIVSTIESRSYIERDQARFKPTSVGVAVNDFLVANFSTIDDVPFTALMEDELDSIAKGEIEWRPMIKSFYEPFEEKLEEVENAARVKIAVEETNENCLDCGAPLVIRTGRFGKFLSCSKFPKCKFTKPFVKKTNLTCPKDGAQIVIKRTKKGHKFYGCSNYPACDFAAWRMEDITRNSIQRLAR